MTISQRLLLASKRPAPPANSYRYVRIVLLAGGQYPTISEVEIRTTTTGSNLCVLGTTPCFASSVYDATYRIVGPIDGVISSATTSMWCGAANNSPNANRSCWWSVDLTASKVIGSVKIACPTDFGRQPTSISIEGSNNNSTWTIIKNVPSTGFAHLVLKEMLT